MNVLKSAETRFISHLFDIKRLVQADLFDSELDAKGTCFMVFLGLQVQLLEWSCRAPKGKWPKITISRSERKILQSPFNEALKKG